MDGVTNSPNTSSDMCKTTFSYVKIPKDSKVSDKDFPEKHNTFSKFGNSEKFLRKNNRCYFFLSIYSMPVLRKHISFALEVSIYSRYTSVQSKRISDVLQIACHVEGQVLDFGIPVFWSCTE